MVRPVRGSGKMSDEMIRSSHGGYVGRRYRLHPLEDRYVILGQEEEERFPKTPEGWTSAWDRFVRLEEGGAMRRAFRTGHPLAVVLSLLVGGVLGLIGVGIGLAILDLVGGLRDPLRCLSSLPFFGVAFAIPVVTGSLSLVILVTWRRSLARRLVVAAIIVLLGFAAIAIPGLMCLV